jgi:threonine/homoserine/homoserine lactone efflux protein
MGKRRLELERKFDDRTREIELRAKEAEKKRKEAEEQKREQQLLVDVTSHGVSLSLLPPHFIFFFPSRFPL